MQPAWHLKWFQPLLFVGYRNYNDVREWGFQLDLRTEVTYYTYDWGRGVTFVILGLGFEVVALR